MVSGSSQHYGQQRLLASLGWGVSAALVGALGVGHQAGFRVMLLLWSLDILVIGFFREPTGFTPAASREPAPSTCQILARLRGLLLDQPLLLLLLFFCLCHGVLSGLSPFYFLHLEELAQWSGTCGDVRAFKRLQGLSLAFSTMGEVPVLLFSGKIGFSQILIVRIGISLFHKGEKITKTQYCMCL